jgi:hypothetical protein
LAAGLIAQELAAPLHHLHPFIHVLKHPGRVVPHTAECLVRLPDFMAVMELGHVPTMAFAANSKQVFLKTFSVGFSRKLDIF